MADTDAPHNHRQDAPVRELHRALGAAIADWQLLERALEDIHRAAIVPKFPGGLSASLAALTGFDAKLRCANASVHFVGRALPAAKTKWLPLYDRLLEARARCERLLNFSVHEIPDGHKGKVRVTLVPINFDHGDPTSALEPAEYGVREVGWIGKSFCELALELNRFSAELSAMTAPPNLR